MKIALLGAPDSGKGKFARKLARVMARDEIFQKPAIIDGYVDDLRQKTGQAYDFSANYSENFQVIFHRRTQEETATHQGKDTITCGTIYETLVYCGIHSLILSDLKQNTYEENIKAKASFKMLGQLEHEMYDYEAIFFLPYDEPTIINKGRSYDMVIDYKLKETLEGFKKECVILNESDKENVKYAYEIVRAIRQNEILAATAEDEQSAVRGSEEDDSALQEIGRVSDLWQQTGGDSTGDQGVAPE